MIPHGLIDTSLLLPATYVGLVTAIWAQGLINLEVLLTVTGRSNIERCFERDISSASEWNETVVQNSKRQWYVDEYLRFTVEQVDRGVCELVVLVWNSCKISQSRTRTGYTAFACGWHQPFTQIGERRDQRRRKYSPSCRNAKSLSSLEVLLQHRSKLHHNLDWRSRIVD